MGFFILSEQQKKGQLASGRRVGHTEKANAALTAQQQMRDRQRDKITLYIGTPRTDPFATLLRWVGIPNTLYVPYAPEGIGVCGAPGKGKSGSVIDPLIRSSLDQGFPTIIYDFSGEQLRRHAAYAAALGYEVYVYAPGQPWSGTINILDFLNGPNDAEMAKQLAVVLNRNSSSGTENKGNKYFTDSADLLMQSLFMQAKRSSYPDLLMAWSILKLPDLAKRLELAEKEGWLDVWDEIGASALTSVAHAPPTSGGIVSTAKNTLAPLISPKFVPCLCGQTTIPLELTGKKLLVLQMEQETRDVVAPLLATILNLVVVKNIALRAQHSQSEPLVLAMDEFPTVYIPDINKWMSEYRKYGFIPILGYQFSPQMDNKYGKDLTRIVLGDCATNFGFNPQDYGTAEEYSKYFGEEEIIIKTRSQTYGKQSSSSRSEQYHKRPIYSPRDILTMRRWTCIFRNPAYEGTDEAALPWRIRIKIPQADKQAEKRSEALWDKKVRDRLIQRAKRFQLPLDDKKLRQELYNRTDLADSLFPPLANVNQQGEASS